MFVKLAYIIKVDMRHLVNDNFNYTLCSAYLRIFSCVNISFRHLNSTSGLTPTALLEHFFYRGICYSVEYGQYWSKKICS